MIGRGTKFRGDYGRTVGESVEVLETKFQTLIDVKTEEKDKNYIAWQGLVKTVAWNNLSNAEKLFVNQKLQELKGRPKCQ